MRGNVFMAVALIIQIILSISLFISSREKRKVINQHLELKKTYDSLSTELRRTEHERDNFILRFDSLNIRYKDLVSLDSIKTEELKSIKGRYKTKNSQELQKLMIDGAKE